MKTTLIPWCLLLALLPGPARADEENDRLTRLARRAGSAIHWIRDPCIHLDLARGGATSSQPPNPAVDRKVLLAEALDRARAGKRLVLVYAFRIAGGQIYRGPVLDDYMNLAVFSDPELAALINRKFIPLRLYVDRRVGQMLGVLNARDRKDLFLKTVVPALLFLSPEGKVLHIVQRIRTFSVHWMRHVLKEVLRIHSKFDSPSVTTRGVQVSGKNPDTLVHLAREQCQDGNEEDALITLEKAAGRVDKSLADAEKKVRDLEAKKPGSPAKKREARLWGWRLMYAKKSLERAQGARMRYLAVKAKAMRLLRRSREALASLQEKSGKAVPAPGLTLEAARMHLALGDRNSVVRVLAGAPPSSETEYLLGAVRYLSWDEDRATAHFRRSVDLGEGPWSYKAAAMLALADDTTPLSPLAHGFSLLEYGPAALYRPGIPTTTEIPRTGSPARARKAVVRAAFDYLLSQQRPDGSWSDTRYAYWPAPRILPNVRVAITALSATAILSWWDLDPGLAEAAVVKAEQYLRDDGMVALGTEEEVYAQAYRILYWVRKAEVSPQSKSEARKHLDALVKRAAAIQHRQTGFFTHEYPNAFCSGAMLWSLHLAKEAGVKVPERLLKLGVKALLSARREDGTFAYSGSHRPRKNSSGKKENVTDLKNSSARMPHCEGILLALGSSNQKKLRKAFRTFLKYLDRLARVRKCDFHSDGELGGFFFWHAVLHASEAKSLLTGPLKKQVESVLLDLVTGFPEIDGSFIDSHELGKSYGTAMALLVLKNLWGVTQK